MVFTPSPSGWCEGILLALADASDKPFVFKFIDCRRDKHGCVSGGSHRRRQVSHQRKAKNKDIARSLRNLHLLVGVADSTDDTSSLLAQFTPSAAKGGLFLAGHLLSQELINVLTKVEAIMNDYHAHNVQVAKGTKTSERLAKLGIRTETQQTNLMTYLSQTLNHPRDKLENALCEGLRFQYSRGQNRFYDSVNGEHLIYTREDGLLKAFDAGGGEVDILRPTWDKSNDEYEKCWWSESGGADLSGCILLTNK